MTLAGRQTLLELVSEGLLSAHDIIHLLSSLLLLRFQNLSLAFLVSGGGYQPLQIF